MVNTTNTGNAGEHLVMAELLSRGFHAFLADRANPAFDIAVYKDSRHALIRVKTTTGDSAQWSTKADGTIFLEMKDEGDFVAIVRMKGAARAADIYIVPTAEVDAHLRRNHKHYASIPARDGQPRGQHGKRIIHFTGRDTERSIGRNYVEKWAGYLEAWHLLG